MDQGNTEPSPSNVTHLDSAKRMQLLANRAARGIAPKPDTQRLRAGETRVTSIGSNLNSTNEPYLIIDHLVETSLRPTVYTWLRTIGDDHGEQARATTVANLVAYLKAHPHANYNQLHDVIWGR